MAVERVVIVGASLAGVRAAETLRQERFAGTITMDGAEAHRPYDRPPLSKKVLSGEWEPDRIQLRRPEALDELGIEWVLGDAASGLDLDARRVRLASGSSLDFDGLVIATGAEVRRLRDQPDWAGVHVIRTLDDSLRLRSELVEGTRVVVIGAGFIGLEVAATARQRGCQVTVLEGADAPMKRGLGSAMGRAAAMVHVDHGVNLRFGVAVEALVESAPGRVGGVRLAGGETVPAEVVVVGIGVVPSTGWLEGSGLQLSDGVVCDATLNAGVPGVYAAGDVVRWYNERYGANVRIEHWTTASEQGAAAARNLLAVERGDPPTPYSEVPFFWSDQFGSRIQFLGRADGDENVTVVLGSVEERSFVALYEREGRLRAALGVSRPKQLMQFRRLLVADAGWDEALEFARGLSV